MFKWLIKNPERKYPKLYKLVEKAGDIYQDIEVNGKKILKGGCPVDCDLRWKTLDNLPTYPQVILEMGSDMGFFTVKLARSRPQSLIWSFDVKEKAEIQKEVLRLNKIKNVILSSQPFWTREARSYSECVEGIDLLIAMSVFHHHPPKETKLFLRLVSSFIPALLVEYPIDMPLEGDSFPDRESEPMQMQYSNLHLELQKRYRVVGLAANNYVGRDEANDYDETRAITLCFNQKLEEREKLSSWINYRRSIIPPRGNALSYDMKTGFTLRRKFEESDKDYKRPQDEWVRGLNLWNVLQHNVIYPGRKYFQKEIVRAYDKVHKDKPTEIGLKNLVMTAQGLKAIDYNHNDPSFSPITFEKEIEKTLKEFNKINYASAK